jgi:hypothetical protein
MMLWSGTNNRNKYRPTLPMDFESSTIAYSFVGFDGGAVTKLLILIAQE